MSIAPVKCSVDVKAPLARAFELFAGNMGAWWPRGMTPGGSPHAELVIEPRTNGRWFERDAAHNETQWGRVLAWEPPRRLLLGWQLGPDFRYNADLLMEVEILFEERAGGGTRVSLEHRDLQQLGADAEIFAGKVRTGWPARLQNFAEYAVIHP